LFQDFAELEDLEDWVESTRLENGYIIHRRRSKKNNSGERERNVWLVCDRSGVYKSKATVRRTGSKKINCLFQLVAVYTKSSVWNLEVRNGKHNHPPAQHLEGHPFARRLTASEYLLVGKLYEQNMKPRNILAAVREENPGSVCIKRDIHNVVAKIKREKQLRGTPMQVLENLLSSKKYVYYTRENADTNAVEEIFFVHPKSYHLWRAFPHVLFIDATYKTNMYNLPFIQVIGVTSTSESFCVAHAFVSREREDNYIWVLKNIKSMLDKCMEPRVILTDRELALMNACAKVFPNASNNLCRWHIQMNIARSFKEAFTSDDWDIFTKSWSRLCESPTVAIYEYNYDRLYKRLSKAHRRSKFSYGNTFHSILII